MDKARNVRRAAKGTLTRAIGTVNVLIEAKRPWEKTQNALANLSKCFESLLTKHEEYTILLDDDGFEEAEQWMDACTREFNECNMVANDYVRDAKRKEADQKQGLNDENIVLNADENDANEVNEIVDINVNVNDVPDANVPGVHEANVNDGNENAGVNANANVNDAKANVSVHEVNDAGIGTDANANVNANVNASPNGKEPRIQNANSASLKEEKPIVSVSLRHEKPKLPTFSGDIRKYFIFKDDFKHAIESRCSERDTITILRTCLGSEPSKLVEGISNDLKTVWKYLDQNYGDPRVVSDTITSDLEKFKVIQPGEDNRFCEFVNLVRRSYNILKEIKRPQDIDNTHIISLIERKLPQEDQRVWSRCLNHQKKEPSMSLLLEWLEEEMSARMRSGAGIRKPSAVKHSVHAVYERPNRNAVKPPHNPTKEKPQCYVCQSQHYIDECPRFKEMSVKERWKVVKDKHACFCCLKYSKDHSAANCKKKRECGEATQDNTCKKFHHKLLHCEFGGGVLSITQEQSTALLPVSVAVLKGKGDSKKQVNILYDTGAQVSMIRNGLAESMGLSGKPIKIYLTKVGGTEEELDTTIYKVTLCTKENVPIQAINAIGIPQISDEITEVNVDVMASKFSVPASELKRKSGPIDILVGINYPNLHVGETKVKDGLVLRKGPLGWVVFGVKEASSADEPKQVMHVRVANPVDITEFWSTESMGVAIQPCTCQAIELSSDERKELNLIEQSCKLIENRWQMSYPWKKDAKQLPNNYSQVLKKLESTERRLSKQPEYAESYNKQIKEMEEMGFSRKLTQKELQTYNGPVHYISHHAVVRPEKKSTPIRIVFNSSATFQGHQLNDYWYKGPDLLNSLFGVILHFRENSIAVVADISKMYHMITIPLYDQHVHRFIWRYLETDQEPETYVKTVLTFGDRPSPAMATVALRKTAELKEVEAPKAAEAIIKNTYMDDICDSVDSIEEANKLTSDINAVLATGGFKVKGWTSNASKDEQSQEVTLGAEEESEKVLGVVWNPKEDKFSYKVNSEATSVKDVTGLTKRKILSKVAGIFDPIGAGAAILVKAKIAMQELWQLGLGWDDEVPNETKHKWIELFKELTSLNDIKFDRCLKVPNAVEDPWLIIFSDASRLAFGACAYIRWKVANGEFEVRFIAAKTRVSPLKELTIPRLELQAAVMASRLAKTIREQSRFNFSRTIYFIDSLVVKAWIQGQSRCYKPFVSHRIGEIQSSSEPSEWFYCPTQLNVADDLTKGITTKELQGRWMNGPQFLQVPEDQWPSEQGTADMTEVNKERRKPTLAHAVTVKEPIIRCEEFSTWKRLLRVTAYVRRFIYNCRKEVNKAKQLDPLSAQEIAKAEDYWVRSAQSSLHKRLERGDLSTLTPFVDENGIIKVGGRVDPALTSYDNQHATLLPYNHWIATLITRDAHQYGHAGIATMTAKVRKKFWIIKGNSISKRVKRQCTFCKKIQARVSNQFMADLPTCRQQPYTPPFLYTSCDYFGPIKVKVGRNKTTKHYGVIFTCLNTRAVHCELATDASSMELLQVLRRFFAHRGYPKLLLSDNGTQMVGADRELREMIEGWDVTKLKEYCAERGMKWQFITPLAPHQNGCAESMIKSVRKALKKAIGDTVLTPFELYTCLLEAANIVNQRPIGRIPNDPNDGSYLCPNDILLGRCSSTIPQGPFRETKNPRHRF